MTDAPKQPTNGDLGRAAYEAWWRVRVTQPDPPSPRPWDKLSDTTQRYWIKEALHGR